MAVGSICQRRLDGKLRIGDLVGGGRVRSPEAQAGMDPRLLKTDEALRQRAETGMSS